MPKCSYCGKVYDIPKGLTFVKIDGTVLHLCSSKCRKNMNMKRRKVKWILKRKDSKKEILDEIKAEAAEEVHEEIVETVSKKNKNESSEEK